TPAGTWCARWSGSRPSLGYLGRSASIRDQSSSRRNWTFGHMNGVVLDFSRPGKPTDNGFIESFNAKVRSECVDQNWFLSLEDARLKCEAYPHDSNNERPHTSVGNKSPVEFMKSIGATCHPEA